MTHKLKPPPIPGILWLAAILFAGWLVIEGTAVAYATGYLTGTTDGRTVESLTWLSQRDSQIEALADLLQAKNPKLYRSKALLYARLIYQECDRYGIGHLQLTAQILQESGLREDATGAAGEIGLMQILPWWLTRADVLGLEPISQRELYDPAQNIRWGVAILARCLRNTNGDLFKALCFYNAGPRWERGKRYAEKVLRLRSMLERHMAEIRG